MQTEDQTHQCFPTRKEGNNVNMKEIKGMTKMKKKEEKMMIKESNERYRTIQKGIDDAWN